jgi:hypothetical protein
MFKKSDLKYFRKLLVAWAGLIDWLTDLHLGPRPYGHDVPRP